ncbi:hypothetical protein GeomeDRAFT_0170 [Geobacter metallireducens RCH3]|uniref:Uncharacterized protein n=1 Tax=Geobacter metallireducens (strain ATCC 53774 / DSM 7210 / GS-15) TaxID=269799 RepID=Q39VH4_GEOMG|nr:hypothetical protein [Geobacter metallireducens]ABB31750.1 hypothetical protein Gmet_1516 [Geobacter metallireducens GS-15]EHP89372.1 hypothetical protein GeomeDRAFT_0170 [Geobacter metallireducens RCH3]
MAEVAIKIGGILSALVGIGHCSFYRGFGWREDFAGTKILTARVLYTIHLFLIPMFLFFAYASLFHTSELAGGTPLGVAMSTFYASFWLFRLIWQVVYFRPAQIPELGRLLPLHYFLIVSFVVLAAAYGVPLTMQG